MNMESIISSISEMLIIVKDNFWQIFTIIALLSHKGYKGYGIILLLIQTLFGYIRWAYVFVIILGYIIDVSKYNEISNYEFKTKQLQLKVKELEYKLKNYEQK